MEIAPPIIALRRITRVARGEHRPPSCEHGEWTFAGADRQTARVKVAMPDRRMQARVRVGEGRPSAPARPASRSGKLYRGRGAVEREFGRLKHEHGLLPLRLCGIDRVKLHADLTILGSSRARWSGLESSPLRSDVATVRGSEARGGEEGIPANSAKRSQHEH